MHTHKYQTYIPAALYLLCIFIEWIYFGGYLTSPNSYMVAFGGDPLVIYTDMKNHICHGDGFLFAGMNHPYGESIFMTDMQAGFTLLWQWVHTHLFDICDYIPGLIHSTIFYLMPFATIFLYKILRKLGIPLVWSILFAILIAFLSPQLYRVRAQLSLPYPFLVPMAIYWFLDLYDRQRPMLRDLGYGFVLFFFTLNNAYTGMIASLTLVAIGGLLLLSTDWRRGLRIAIAGLAPLVLGYLVIRSTDPFVDRVDLQWGTFYYNTNLQGLLFPTGSLLRSYIDTQNDLPVQAVGKRTNLGLGNIVTWAIILGLLLVSIFQRKNRIPFDKRVFVMLLAGLAVLLYAANSALFPTMQPFVEKHLRTLLMFKASGRVAWITYYLISVVGVVLLFRILHSSRHGAWTIALPIIAALAWTAETHHYLDTTFTTIHRKNRIDAPIVQQQMQKIHWSDYEAIYTIPPYQAWNDKIAFPSNWNSEYSALILSASTGLPMINAAVSRSSISCSASASAIASHPALPKPRLKALQTDKPILLLLGWKYEPTVGEQYLLDHATYVGYFLRSHLYALDPDSLMWEPTLPDTSALFQHQSFDDIVADTTLIGDGALRLAAGSSELYRSSMSDFTIGDTLEVSFWYFVDNDSYHTPRVSLEVGEESYAFDNKESKDYYGRWRKQTSIFTNTGQDILVTATSAVPFLIDEVHIQAISDTSYYYTTDSLLIWNGYPTQ